MMNEVIKFMSNLLKSKFLLGVMIVAVMVVGVVVSKPTSASAACSITVTLRVGSKGDQVKCLQMAVGVTADGSFGPKTKAAVMTWQASVGLVADGVFGPKSRAAWMGGSTSTLPAGCTSTSGYSPTTGMPCNSGTTTVLPAGCTSTSGFSATTGQPCNGGTTVNNGPVGVMLATNNPASSTLVAAQATADLAHFAFTGNGVVTGITLQRIGVSGDATLSNVYLFDGATRLTDSASVSNNGMISFNVPAGIFTVNGSKVVSVKSDILTGTSGQTVGVMLATFTTSSGTVTANLSGNIHTIASATLAGVSAGTVTPSGATINPAAGVTVWQSTLSVTNRDVWMKRLALRNVGSAPASAFQNFKLYVNGVQVGTAASLDSMGYVTFDLSSVPVLLVAGSRVVRVDADVVSGASRTVQFSLRQAADVDFVDSSFGVNIAPTSTPWAPSSASTISGTSGGTLTIEKDVSSPSTTVVNNGSDVKLGVFKFTAYGEAIKVETLRATYASSDAAIGSLRNGRILINGVQYGSTATLNEDSQATPYTSYTVNYVFMPGVPVLVEIHADIYDNDGTDSITAGTDTLNAAFAIGSSNAIRQDSLGSFNAPASAVSSNILTIASTSITLSKNGTYADQSLTLPATNFKVGSWNLTGSSVEDVLLTTLSFDIDEAGATTDFDEEDFTNMYAVVKNSAGAIVAQPSPVATLSSDGQDNNFSINYTLVKNTNVTIELFANLSDTSTPTAIDTSDKVTSDLTVTGTSLVSGTSVTAASADTAGQTLTYGAAYITSTVDASSPVKGITYDNQTVTSGAFKFTATTSSFNVTDVTLGLTATGATIVQNVMLYDGASLIATQPAGTTAVTFSGLTWNVPANTSKVLTVKVQLGSVGVGAGTSESSLATTLTVWTSVNTSTGVSDASDADSGQSRESSADQASAVTSVFASVPSITKVALACTTGCLTNGVGVPLLRFKIDAVGGPVSWDQLYFDVIKDANTLIASSTSAGITLWDVTGGGNTAVNGTFTSAQLHTGTDTTGTILFVPTAEEEVSTSATYELRGTVTLANAAGDYVVVTIANDNTSAVVALDSVADLQTADSDAPIIWSDMSASGHATTTDDWTTDFGVQSLPISQTITFPS